MHITRRDAIRGAGAVLVAAAASACAAGGVAEQGPEPVGQKADPERSPEQVVAGMTLEQKVAQLFVVRPEAITGVSAQTEAGEATRAALARMPVGGVVYFAANLVDPEQTRAMLEATRAYSQEACGVPCLLAVDEEGGTVARVGSNPAFGVERVGDMADVGSVQDARAAARTMGRYLADLGFDLDFAPVADIASADGSPLSRRSFGATPEVVSPRVTAQVEAFASEGVLCCAKHFPGMGGVLEDSHDGAAVSSRTLEEMESFELLPFAAAIDQGVPMVMVGHLSCPAVTGDDAPASLSRAVVTGVLRDRLGFTGVVITDSLEMGAVKGACPDSEVAVRALLAGVDLVLMPSDLEAAYQGVLGAVSSGELDEGRIDESVLRVVRMKRGLLA